MREREERRVEERIDPSLIPSEICARDAAPSLAPPKMAAAAPARRWAPTSLSLILLVLASHLPSDRSAASAKLVVGSLKTGENWAFVSRFCFLSLHGRFQALGSNEPPLVQDPLCSGLKPSLEPLVHHSEPF